MGAFKPGVLQHADIIHLENEINNLWGELNTSNIPHILRMELEDKMAGLEEQFKAVMSGHASQEDFQEQLQVIDYTLAIGALKQAQQEVSKIEHTFYQALENVRRELENKDITPLHARHEIKQIMRSK